MDILSSSWVSVLTLTIGFALVSFFSDKTLRLVGFWFFAEFMCDAITTNLGEYALASDVVTYFYLYAITSLIFSVWVLSHREAYSKSIISLFISVSVLSVAFAAYRYFLQSRMAGWGYDFYLDFGAYADTIYFLSIVALEALMVTLGVYSALATNNNSNNSICGKQR